jgi:group I intron endonuclease
MTKKEFIKLATEKFGNKFDYSKVPEIIKNKEKDHITIICPIHGEFIITPKAFFKGKFGCRKCSYELRVIRTEKNSLAKFIPNIDNLSFIENPIITDKSKLIGTVYCFINKQNNKLYFGETVKSDFNERFNEHRSKASKGIVNYFYNAIRKYSWDGFDKIIVYQTDIYDKTEENKKLLNNIVNSKEKEFIKQFNTDNHKFGYNLTKGGDGIVGYKFSEEARQKLSERTSGEKHWNYGNFNNKTSQPILQYNLNKNLIKEWPSMKEAERQLNCNSNNISRCCSGEISTYLGYIWIKKSEFEDELLELKTKKALETKYKNHLLQYDFLGHFIKEWESSSDAAEFIKCDRSTITNAASGKSVQGKGYIWVYKNNFSEELLKEKVEQVKSYRSYNRILREQNLI